MECMRVRADLAGTVACLLFGMTLATVLPGWHIELLVIIPMAFVAPNNTLFRR
jgi:hypothetical protein